jgi:hypothetical protein
MQRVRRTLIVMRGKIDIESLERLFARVSLGHDGDVAIGYELPTADCGLGDALAAQQAITAALRRHYGSAAEEMAVFVAADREGERIDDLAEAWRASEIRR